MRSHIRLLVVVAGLALVGGLGCRTCASRSMCPPRIPPPGPARFPSFAPPCPPGRPSPLTQPVPIPPPVDSFRPVQPPPIGPGSGIQVQPPQPMGDGQQPGSPRLYGPEPDLGTPNQPRTPELNVPPSNKPNTIPDRPLVPPLPVGIPGFAEVRKGVSTGLRPNAIDGLDWLASSGYRTVLHLREPGQDDAGDRKQFESRGIKYLTLEVSPDNLTPETVDRFNQVVADMAGQPLFVYDADGMLSGGMWYLHFRITEQLPDDEALRRAARLGLKTEPSGGHQRMLLAVQKFMAERGGK